MVPARAVRGRSGRPKAHALTGAGPFGLFLLSRGAPCSTSREALRRLHERIHQQIVQRVEAVVDHTLFDSPEACSAYVQQRADQAAALVLPALSSCRANRIHDFRRWLDLRIEDAIAGDPLAAPPGNRWLTRSMACGWGTLSTPF